MEMARLRNAGGALRRRQDPPAWAHQPEGEIFRYGKAKDAIFWKAGAATWPP